MVWDPDHNHIKLVTNFHIDQTSPNQTTYLKNWAKPICLPFQTKTQTQTYILASLYSASKPTLHYQRCRYTESATSIMDSSCHDPKILNMIKT